MIITIAPFNMNFAVMIGQNNTHFQTKQNYLHIYTQIAYLFYG